MNTPRAPRLAAGMGALLGLMAALVVFAPARWLGDALAWATGERLQLLHARGTVWQGQGDLMFSAGAGSQGRTALPQGLQWTWTWRWQGQPVLELALHAPCCTRAPVKVLAVPGLQGLRWQVGPLDSLWPAQLLSGLGTPWNTLQLDGRIQLRSDGLVINPSHPRAPLKGELDIQALDLASRVSTLRPLGSYRLQIQADGDSGNSLTLDTLSGGLLLQGQGQWTGARLRFAGDARAAPGKEAALANLLNIIGRREGARSVLTIG